MFCKKMQKFAAKSKIYAKNLLKTHKTAKKGVKFACYVHEAL